MSTPVSTQAVEAAERTTALDEFTEYFVRNYPGPDTIINDPHWHAPKIFSAAIHALRAELTRPLEGVGVGDAVTLESALRAIAHMDQSNSAGRDADAREMLEPANQDQVNLAACGCGGATQWQPIETAPKTGRTLLLGYFNSHNKWRTLRGQWMSEEYIAENWEEPENGEPGWFEESVEADDAPNCWATNPTHWMPLPAAPKAQEGGK